MNATDGHLPLHEHAPGDSCSLAPGDTNRAIKRLQVVTICWMLVECGVALTAAWLAHSPALVAFGSDSSVELLSAIVVLLQFTSILKVNTERAARLAGILLYVLAGIVGMISHNHARTEPRKAKECELDWEPRLGGRRRTIGHMRLSCRTDAPGTHLECDPTYPLG